MQYSVWPKSKKRTPIPRLPLRPPDDYLRDAMVASLAEGDVEFDIRLQLQTDPHLMPIENNAVLWPEKLSPRVSVATLRLPRQKFDSPAQMEFAKQLSYNPWHRSPNIGRWEIKAVPAPDVRGAFKAAAYDERGASLRADGRRGLRVASHDSAVELHGPGGDRSAARGGASPVARIHEHAPGRVNANNAADSFRAIRHAALRALAHRGRQDDRRHSRLWSHRPALIRCISRFSAISMATRMLFLKSWRGSRQTGLRAIFSCCEGFTSETDLVDVDEATQCSSVGEYVNWRGRTVRRVREEAALREALEGYIKSNASALKGLPPREIHAKLRQFVDAVNRRPRDGLRYQSEDADAARLVDSECAASDRRSAAVLDRVADAPSRSAPFYLIRLRGLEKTDPEVCPRVDLGILRRSGALGRSRCHESIQRDGKPEARHSCGSGPQSSSFGTDWITPRDIFVTPGPPRAHSHDSFRALGVSRRQKADGVFQQL